MPALVFKTQDKQAVEFDTKFMEEHSVLIANMLDNINRAEVKKEELILPMYNHHSSTLERMKKFLEGFDKSSEPNKPITYENRTIESVFANDKFQQEFFRDLTDDQLKLLAEAACFMDVPKLYEACCCAIAIKYKEAQIAVGLELAKDPAHASQKEHL